MIRISPNTHVGDSILLSNRLVTGYLEKSWTNLIFGTHRRRQRMDCRARWKAATYHLNSRHNGLSAAPTENYFTGKLLVTKSNLRMRQNRRPKVFSLPSLSQGEQPRQLPIADSSFLHLQYCCTPVLIPGMPLKSKLSGRCRPCRGI